MQGNEDTTVVASGILGSFKFLFFFFSFYFIFKLYNIVLVLPNITLGLQGMYTILHRVFRRRRVSGGGSRGSWASASHFMEGHL